MPILEFKNEESGAVTVDWVVLTAAIVGIAMAVVLLISGGVNTASNNIVSGVGTSWSFDFGRKTAESYFDFGMDAFPDDQNLAWKAARLQVDVDAPDGYEYDPDLTTTRFVADGTVLPIYVALDGNSYSVGGEIISVEDYSNTDKTSFKSTFDQYWDANQ